MMIYIVVYRRRRLLLILLLLENPFVYTIVIINTVHIDISHLLYFAPQSNSFLCCFVKLDQNQTKSDDDDDDDATTTATFAINSSCSSSFSLFRWLRQKHPSPHHAPATCNAPCADISFPIINRNGGGGVLLKFVFVKKDLCCGCFVCCVHTMLHTKVAKQKPPKQNSLSCHRVFVAFLLLLDASAQQKKIKNWQTYKTKRKSDTYYYY